MKPRSDRNQAQRDRALALRIGGASYAEIGVTLGISRQRVQQILSPSPETRRRVVERAGGVCEGEGCPEPVGPSSWIAHRRTFETTTEYDAEDNLALLCSACHGIARVDPLVRERNRPRTAEERAASRFRQGRLLAARRLGITLEDYVRHRDAGERWCTEHKSWEPPDRFGRESRSHDGISHVCREGNRERVRRYQTPDYLRRYRERKRAELNAYHRDFQRRRRASKAAS